MKRLALLSSVFFTTSSLALAFEVTEAVMGRALYHGHSAFEHGQETTSNRLPRAYVACARCHGPLGEGGREGGVTPPPLTWAALTSPRADLPAFFGEEAVLLAVSEGRARDGKVLSAAMPRYNLTQAEKSHLLGYLRIIGSAKDLPPGVFPDTVRLGALLPLTGVNAAVGKAVLNGLREVFEDVNVRGGVYGRRLDLIIVDTEPHGSLSGAQELLALRPYVLVAGMWNEPGVSAMFSFNRVAKIGNLVQHDYESDLDEWDVDLFAPRNKTSTLETPISNPSEDSWRFYGNAAASLTVELLSRAGSALYERALLMRLPETNGVEIAQGAPVLFSKTRRYAFDFGSADPFSHSNNAKVSQNKH